MRRRAALLAGLLLLAVVLALAARAEAYIYWSGGDTIGRANLDGTGINESFIDGCCSFAAGVAVDGEHIYWSDQTHNATTGPLLPSAIGRADLDGSNVDRFFVPIGLSNQPCGVAVDASYVYWVDAARGTIGRAPVNGSGVDFDFIPGAVARCGIAVDAGHVYWQEVHSIGRANLDGSNVDNDFIDATGTGVAVDEGHVYWPWWASSTGEVPTINAIGRANLDGSAVDHYFITLTPTSFGFQLAVDDEHVYWANGGGYSAYAAPAIGRANLDGTGINESFILPSGAVAVAVDALSSPPPPPTGQPPTNEFSLGKVKKNKTAGTAKLTVNVPGPGELDLAKTNGVKPDEETAEAAGEETLIVKARGGAKKKLNADGKARVDPKVTFTPDDGEPNTERLRIKLIKG